MPTLVLLLLVSGAAVAAAGGAGSGEEGEAAAEAAPGHASAETDDGEDLEPCDIRDAGRKPFLDRTRHGVFETVCSTARWIDGLFGDTSYREPARQLHGRAAARVLGDENDGAEADFDLRVDYVLPNLDRRVDLFLGREDREELISDRAEEVHLVPEFFREANEEEWLVGMGYRRFQGERASLDFDVGIEVRTPLEPYTRARYRRYWVVGDRYLARLRESVYWQNQRGVGTTTGIDLERVVGRNHLIRLANRATLEEASEGVDWRTDLTWFHVLDDDRALAYLVAWEGETDADVPVEEWGGRVTFRQRMFREWFFGELVGGVAWIRDEPGDPREEFFYVGIGFEIQFGYLP